MGIKAFFSKHGQWIVIVLSLVTSIGSCTASFKAVEKAEESNRIARDSAENSKKLFYEENRPFIDIDIKKFEDVGSYLKVTKNTGSLLLQVQFQLRNDGKTPAKDISIPKVVRLSEKIIPKNGVVNLSFPSDVTLAPGHTKEMVAHLELGYQKEDLEKNYQSFIEGVSHAKLNFMVNYSGVLNSNLRYKSKASFDVTTKKALLIGKDMD